MLSFYYPVTYHLKVQGTGPITAALSTAMPLSSVVVQQFLVVWMLSLSVKAFSRKEIGVQHIQHTAVYVYIFCILQFNVLNQLNC